MTARPRRLAAAGIAVCVCATVVLVYLSSDDAPGPASEASTAPTTRASGSASPSTVAPPEPPVGEVVGTVTDTGGTPLSGIEVTVLTKPLEAWSTGPGKPMVPPGPTWTGRTDELGTYRIAGVAVGPHRVLFSATQRGRATHATLFNDGAYVLEHAPDRRVEQGAETRVDAVLPEAARVTGVVRTASGGAAAPYVPVVVLRVDTPAWTEIASTATRSGGRFVVDALAPGAYVLRVDHPASGATYYPAATRARGAQGVELDEGDQVAGLDVDLPGPGTVSGRALRPDGAPLVGVTVNLQPGPRGFGPYDGWPGATERVVTDEDGRYEFRRPTGRHELWLELDNPSHHCTGVHVDHVGVWVDGGRHTLQDLRMEEPVSVRGTVTDTAGKPLRGVEVASEQRLSCQVTARTDRSGHYTLTGLSPGGHRIRFGTADHTGEYFTEYYGGGGSRDAPVMHLAPGRAVEGIDARLALGGRISGKVTLPDDAKLDSLIVTATGEPEPGADSQVEARATVGADGRYEIVGLPTGTYRLAFWPSFVTSSQDQVEGVHYAGGGRTSRDLDDALGVEVTQGRATPGVDLLYDLGATIRGRVVDGVHAPRSGIQVVAYRIDPDAESGWPESDTGWQESSSTWTNASGRYVLRGLLAGSYRVGFGGAHEFFPDVTEIDEAQDIEVEPNEAVRHVDASLLFDWD